MSQNNHRRVAITGVGLVSPLGVGTEASWEALLAGKSGIGPVTRFPITEEYPARIAGEVKGFDPTDYFHKRDVKKFDTFIHYAMAASQFAMEMSGLEVNDANRDRIGAVIGAGLGGLPVLEKTRDTLVNRGPKRVSPFFIPSLIANMSAGIVSIRYGVRGPNSAPATACTTGLHAVGDAYHIIRRGMADAMITGGSESVISPLAFAGFGSMKALSTRNDEPEKASRPWDKDRDGFVIGEGAGILVLEEMESAKARGAEIVAEIVGYGMSGDAHHISAPDPTGDGAIRVMRAALADAAVNPEEVAYVNAHGTSTPLGDLAEVHAVKEVFGDHAYKLAMSSTKSSTGHLLGAAGGLEAGFLALALRDQVLPATLNLDSPDPQADLDFVPHEVREQSYEVALTNSFGFGGTNGALIMRRFQG